MTPYYFILILSLAGIGVAAYLVSKRIAGKAPVCPIGGNCDLITSSQYSKMFLIPLDVWGIIFYGTVLFMAIFLIFGIEPKMFWGEFLKILVVAGVAMSFYFTYLQWRVIKAWCFWCLMSAFVVWLMGVVVFWQIFLS